MIEGYEITSSKGAVAAGPRIERVAKVGSAAHIAEFFKADCKVRAGGNTWAAGVE
jgi:hypothetical protein